MSAPTAPIFDDLRPVPAPKGLQAVGGRSVGFAVGGQKDRGQGDRGTGGIGRQATGQGRGPHHLTQGCIVTGVYCHGGV